MFSLVRFSSVVRLLLAGLALLALALGACGEPLPVGTGADALAPGKTSVPSSYDMSNGIWGGVPAVKPPNFPTKEHLVPCKSDDDCGKLRCVNLGGGSQCYFTCKPEDGEGEKQNPACLRPENCVRLTDGSGLCAYLPGQLFGSGSYKAVIRLAKDARCLLQYDGCDNGLLCVDTKQDGSVGRCVEECTPAADPNAKVQPVCTTAGTVCKELASGFGACLPK